MTTEVNFEVNVEVHLFNCSAHSAGPGNWKLEDGRWKMEEGRGKQEEGRGKREEGRAKREEGRGSRKCQEALMTHQGGTEEAPCIYKDSRASISKTGI